MQNGPNLKSVVQGSMFFKRFWTVLEACAQTWNCEKHRKTSVFLIFFVGRAFFKKGSAVEGKSTTKSSLGAAWHGFWTADCDRIGTCSPLAGLLDCSLAVQRPSASKSRPKSTGWLARQAQSGQRAQDGAPGEAQEASSRPGSAKKSLAVLSVSQRPEAPWQNNRADNTYCCFTFPWSGGSHAAFLSSSAVGRQPG